MPTISIDANSVAAPGEVLLISDDVQRAQRLARDLTSLGRCHVHDLYEATVPSLTPSLIVSDVEELNSEAIVRLRDLLGRVRREPTPYLFLTHGNVARAEAQARVLGANGTLSAMSAVRLIHGKLVQMRGTRRSVPAATIQQATRLRLFLAETFFSGQSITPPLVENGTELIVRAIQDAGVHDWVAAVQRFDDVTHQHCLLVAGLAAAFSGALGLGSSDRHRLVKAALLHDVGKTRIPTTILNKPAPLDAAELAVMRTHPALGHAMLAGAGFDDVMLAVVRSHHEMLDGSGYPDGLRADEIPDLVRLVTVCDIYAALIERRPYRAPMEGRRAYDVLTRMTGQLDADLVRAFRPVTGAAPEGGATVAAYRPRTSLILKLAIAGYEPANV